MVGETWLFYRVRKNWGCYPKFKGHRGAQVLQTAGQLLPSLPDRPPPAPFPPTHTHCTHFPTHTSLHTFSWVNIRQCDLNHGFHLCSLCHGDKIRSEKCLYSSVLNSNWAWKVNKHLSYFKLSSSSLWILG